MDWIILNWPYIMVGFYVLEKIVKLSPTDKDDIIVDIVWSGLKMLVKGKK